MATQDPANHVVGALCVATITPEAIAAHHRTTIRVFSHIRISQCSTRHHEGTEVLANEDHTR
jgi:hypothetical protein